MRPFPRACILALLSSGCGAAPGPIVSASVAVHEPAPDNGNARRIGEAAHGGPMHVTWAEVASSVGCFFFSGPGGLGRDDDLGETALRADEGSSVRITFGAGLTFQGARASGPLLLSRSATHDFSGPWTTHESLLVEELPDGSLRGRYHYDELAPGSTTPGECHIDAFVELSPMR